MARIGLFVTCLVDCMRPQVGVAAVQLLRASGAQVVYPPEQSCCGQIAFNSGYQDDARRLAEKCFAEFADCDAVVIPSGSCCGMFRAHLGELFADSHRPSSAFRDKCWELSQYLTQVGWTPPATAPTDAVVTFHDSCAGLRELNIGEAPRRLLRDSGVRLTEMSDCRECCGFGGRFAEQFGELSTALADRKCDNIIAANARAVVAGDVGCLLHLEGRLRRRGNALPVFHWAEVVADPTVLHGARH